MDDNIDWVKTHAFRMATILEGNFHYIDGLPYVSNRGLASLGNYFDSVPYELRAAVFEGFVEELNDRGIEYDVDQFKGSVN